jgi:hypothetical protein
MLLVCFRHSPALHTQRKDVKRLKYTHKKTTKHALWYSDLDWIRTNDPQLRRLMLYPAELPSL